MSSSKVFELIKQASNYDKDNRYMAVSDICGLLKDESSLELGLESKLCMAVLERLDDKSNDVQSIAVKCLALLVKKVHEEQVFDISDKLCNYILSGKEELRDIYSIGLKEALKDMPQKTGEQVAVRILNRLIKGMKSSDVSVRLECIDIVSNLIEKFGMSLTDYPKIAKTLTLQLSHERPIVRKRATHCLGNLALFAEDGLLNEIITNLLDQIEALDSQSTTQHTLIQVIGTVSKVVGYRIGVHSQRIVSLFLSSLKAPEDESMQNELGDELRENILNALESLVVHCPSEITQYLDSIVGATRKLLAYDPNYNYTSGKEDAMEEDEDDYDEDDYEDDDYSDDDDTSWKVRRSSIKLLNSTILSRSDYALKHFDQLAALLIGRFKEREDTVRIEIVSCVTALIITSAKSKHVGKCVSLGTGTESPLSKHLESLMKPTLKILGERKALKSKVAVVTLLRASVGALDGGFERYLDQVMTHIIDVCKNEKDPTLKLEVLLFLEELLKRQAPHELHAYANSLCPVIIGCCADGWYKVVAESLRVIKAFVKVVRPRQGEMFTDSKFDFVPLVQPLYEAIYPRLSSHDIDQEIKESAIDCVGTLLSHFGDHMKEVLPVVLGILTDKLKNEMTRLASLKCLSTIALSPLSLGMHGEAPTILQLLSHFLRQQSRVLKQQTLETMNSVIQTEKGLDEKIYSEFILPETGALISDSDLQLCQLSLDVCASSIKACPASITVLKERIVPKVVHVIQSPLMQRGPTLNSMLALFAELSVQNHPSLDFEALIKITTEMASRGSSDKMETSEHPGHELSHSRNVVHSVASCLSAICLNCADKSKQDETVRDLIRVAQEGDLCRRQVAVCALGAIGREVNMKEKNPTAYTVVAAIVANKDAPEVLKAEAAVSLGNLTVGCMEQYLPVLVDSLQTRTSERQQYLLLTALLQIIESGEMNASSIIAQEEKILPVLERNCENKEEGVRNMVAECLGKIGVIDPTGVIPRLAALCTDEASDVKRWTLVTSVKHLVVNKAASDVLLSQIKPFLVRLNDTDLTVRRAALLAVNSTAHNAPKIFEAYASEVLPIIYSETKVRPELKRKVDLGPFKHTIDDGLPLRKAAYASINTVLVTAPGVVDLKELLPCLAAGLKDVEDIMLLAHESLQRVCELHPLVLLSQVNVVLPPLRYAMEKLAKEKGSNATRTNDVLRSAVRTVHKIHAIPQASQVRSVQELWTYIQTKAQLSCLVEPA